MNKAPDQQLEAIFTVPAESAGFTKQVRLNLRANRT